MSTQDQKIEVRFPAAGTGPEGMAKLLFESS